MNLRSERRAIETDETDRIFEGMIVRNGDQPAQRGVLGVFVEKIGSRELFGVIASHLIAPDSRFYDDNGNVQVGIGVSLGSSPDDEANKYKPIGEALGLISVERTLIIPPSFGPTAFSRIICDPAECLGQPVTRLRRNASLATATLTGLEIPLAIRSRRDGKVRRYSGAMEVSWSLQDEPFASFGDSGSMVYSESRKMLGIVIGGIGHRCFVAPLFRIVGQYEIASTSSFLAHNDRTRSFADAAMEEEIKKKYPVVLRFADLIMDE